MASSPSSAAANKAAASTEAASSAGLSQGAAFQKYRELAQESNRLVSKISELEMERGEHVLVEETLRPLDPDRRAYRLVGEVLVERNVQEVLPSVEGNRKNLEASIAVLREKLVGMQKESAELKTKYNLQTEAPAR